MVVLMGDSQGSILFHPLKPCILPSNKCIMASWFVWKWHFHETLQWEAEEKGNAISERQALMRVRENRSQLQFHKASSRLEAFWFGKLFVQEIAYYIYVFKSVFHIFSCLGNIQWYNLFHFWVHYVLPPLLRGGVRSHLFSRELAFGQSFLLYVCF